MRAGHLLGLMAGLIGASSAEDRESMGSPLGLDGLPPPRPPRAPGPVTVEEERALRAAGYKVKRPRFTKQDVRLCARQVFPEIADVRYVETATGLEVVGVLTGTGLRDSKVRCKLGEENRMRTGFIRFLVDGASRDRLRA